MKQIFITAYLISVVTIALSQEVLRLKNGSNITVQNGAELTLLGGITLENGSLLINNGTTRLLNNSVANQSDWKDNSVTGALGGNGLILFNSTLLHQFWGTTHFYNVQINTGGITINNHFTVDNQLNLLKGKINTTSNYVFLANNSASSLVNDVSNTGYTNSWINGNFRRSISTNTSTYDFPVGNNTRPNLLQFLNNSISGSTYLTASFGAKPGTDVGLSVSENGVAYTSVNNGGIWNLTPDVAPTSGNYALQLYFNGFAGLSDNLFGILRRPDASSNAADWVVPSGSSLEAINGSGRKGSDGFARRKNISTFSQWGIGMMGSLPCINCSSACTYTQGFYGNVNGMACYNNSGTLTNSSELMMNAFGASTAQVFGNVANRRFFTLYKTDITSKNIYKMLPGSGNSQTIAVDNVLPYNGAYYSDPSTWSLVPMQSSGSQKGKINNLLLSQTIALWFNLRTGTSLAGINLSMDTLVTVAQTFCGSGILIGAPIKFGLPHNVIVYLNGGNGYANNVSGLFQLANDVLGAANSGISAADMQSAVASINNAFDGCRVLAGTIPYTPPVQLMQVDKTGSENKKIEQLTAITFPNPFDKQFSLLITSPVSGIATIEFFEANGKKIREQTKYIQKNSTAIVLYKDLLHRSLVLYSIRIGSYKLAGKVISLD